MSQSLLNLSLSRYSEGINAQEDKLESNKKNAITTKERVLPTDMHSADSALSAFYHTLFQQEYPWLECSVETLYAQLYENTKEGIKIRSHLTFQEKEEERNTSRMYGVPTYRIPINIPEKSQESVTSILQKQGCLIDNIEILQSLRLIFEEREIILPSEEFLLQPEGKSSCSFFEPLKAIQEQIKRLLEQEYLFISQLMLAPTLLDKMDLLVDYLMPDSFQPEYIAIRTSLIEQDIFEKSLYLSLFKENLTQAIKPYTDFRQLFFFFMGFYAYGVTGLHRLVDNTEALANCQSLNEMDQIKSMKIWVENVQGEMRSTTDHVGQCADEMRISFALHIPSPTRLITIINTLASIRQLLLSYEEQAVNAYVARELGIEIPIVKGPSIPLKKRNKPNIKRTKKSQAGNKSTKSTHKLQSNRTPSIHPIPQEILPEPIRSITSEQIINSVPLPLFKEKMTISSQPIIDNLQNESQLKVSRTPSQSTDESEITLSSDLNTSINPIIPIKPSAVPASHFVDSLIPPQLILTMNPKIAPLNNKQQALYQKIYSDKSIDNQNIKLADVENMIRKLGGQIKGVGGSRLQLIFNNRSVATIEQRHGGDKAGTLNKWAVALLKRGLDSAGFSPIGWQDPLSASYQKLTTLIEYTSQMAIKTNKAHEAE